MGNIPTTIIDGEEYVVFDLEGFEFLKKKIKELKDKNKDLEETLDHYMEMCDILMEDD